MDTGSDMNMLTSTQLAETSNFGMKLRPRRSALSDISNTIAQQFSSVFAKKTTGKKRKSNVSAIASSCFPTSV
jgi:hypothetical protein